MSTTPAPALPKVNNTWGVLYIGAILETALWAAATVQLYYYYDEYRKDRWMLKLLVAIVWAFDTAHLIFELIIPYFVLVSHYGDPFYLTAVVSLTDVGDFFILLSGFVVLFVQAFYVHRIWRLSQKNNYLLVLLASLLCTEFGANTAYFAKIHPMTSVFQWLTLTRLAKSILVLDAVTSVLITSLVIFYLHRSRTGFRRTESMINRLIMWTVNTGLLTSICAVASLVFVVIEPDNFIYIAFYGVISKLYTNSFLATLNIRKKGRRNASSNDSNNTASSMSFSHILERQNRNDTNPITINIQKESCVLNDAESAGAGKD